MKKLVFAALAVFAISNLNAQDSRYGIKAGFNSLSLKASAEGISASDSASGFYVGTFAEFGVSETFAIQPELQYVSVSQDGENSGLLVLPVMAKYKPTTALGILAGPQLDYLLDEDSEGINKLGLSLAAGLSYDITEKFIIDARYSLGLSNRLEDAEDYGTDISLKFNMIQVGLGYRF